LGKPISTTMKTISVFFTLLFVFSVLTSLGQDKNFKLLPQYGNTYLYEFTNSKYLINKEGKKVNEFITTKLLEVNCSIEKSENKKSLRVKVLKSTADKPQEKPYQLRDYQFPPFKYGFYNNNYNNFYEQLFFQVSFLYDFDEKTSTIKLVNREEILLKVRSILEEKGFNKKGMDRNTDDFNTKAIPQITNYVQSLYQVKSEVLDPSEYDQKLEVKDSITKLTTKRWDKKPGLYSMNTSINMAERFLKESNTIEIDTFKYRMSAQGEYHNGVYTENNVELIKISQNAGTRLTISGKVENQKNKKVTLVYLRKPYGTEVFKETVFLDENNTFQIETEFKHAGMVFLIFGQTTSTINLPTIPIYAEPGSRIQINTKGESFPWDIEFSGDFSDAQKMLYNFNKEYNLLKWRLNFNTLMWWSFTDIAYEDLINALKDFESFTEEYKTKIDEPVFDFITKELKANLLSGVLNYLDRWEMFNSLTFYSTYFPEKDKVDVEFLIETLNSSEIHKIYNQYGIHSRQMAKDYLVYHFQKVKKINDLNFPEFTQTTVLSDFLFYDDLPQKIEVAKTLFTGPALYSLTAEILIQEKIRVSNEKTQDAFYVQIVIENYLDLFKKVCNNEEFTNAIKEVLENYSKWKKDDYIPETKFFNQKGEAKYFKDFLGKKPTIFYVSTYWDRERYFWDDLAKENPEINFVMVMDGSNYNEWKDYIDRAEPTAYQLFLLNQNEQLSDIFEKNFQHFIVYDKNGIRIHFVGDMVFATNLAKQSLSIPKKKELNKSQLKLIILALGIVILIALVVFAIWKWRVRQRFRREQQQRRLRELELTAIRSQMNPHFLFNSLNSVQNLVQQNKGREAHLYLSDFAGLIRKVLQNSEKEEVSLAEELEMTEQYLNLEKLRFDFDFSISVEQGIDINNTMVPSMLLQPFAENAVIHGLQNKPENRKLRIEVRKADEVPDSKRLAVQNRLAHKSLDTNRLALKATRIIISIEDNGIGREAAAAISKTKNGKGSKLIQERLEILQEKQGEKYSLKTIDLEEGTRVEIFIPEEN